MTTTRGFNSPYSSEEKALLLALTESGGRDVTDEELLGPVADSLVAHGFFDRKIGQDGHVYGTVTGRGVAFARMWKKEEYLDRQSP